MAEATVDNATKTAVIETNNDIEINNAVENTDAVETADTFELARNPIHVNLQHRLIENTDSLERMRDAYLELVLEMGEDAFDLVPDRYGIRELVVQYGEIHRKLKSIR